MTGVQTCALPICTGGIIISSVSSKEELQTIIAQDPFSKFEIAKYEVIEFSPSMAGEGFEKLLD